MRIPRLSDVSMEGHTRVPAWASRPIKVGTHDGFHRIAAVGFVSDRPFSGPIAAGWEPTP